MISLTEVVLRLRAQCASFERHVGGTLEFGEAFIDATADLALPHCFVIPMEDIDISAVIPDDDKRQQLRFFFATVVAVDNSANRGKPGGGVARLEPFDKINLIREELLQAFLGWRPVQRFKPVRFSRGANLGMDNKRLWWQFEWFVELEENTDTTSEEEDAIAQIIDDVDNDVPGLLGEDFLTRLRKIYVSYGLGDPGPRVGLDDFWMDRAQAAPGVEEADAETVQEKKDNAEVVILVPDDIPPIPTPSDKEVDAAASHPPAPEPTGFHGPSAEIKEDE